MGSVNISNISKWLRRLLAAAKRDREPPPDREPGDLLADLIRKKQERGCKGGT